MEPQFDFPDFDTSFRLDPVIESQKPAYLEDLIDYTAEPTPALFHNDDSFFRGIMGPIGSGKTVCCAVEMMRRICEQTPYRGIRRSRWAVVRNTFPELKTTTIKTWEDWFESISSFKFSSPIECKIFIDHPDNDGTKVSAEILFIALDVPDDVKKLKSLELTGIWFNEAVEIRKSIIDMGMGRIGRYPKKDRGGPSWTGGIADTNPPDDLHWWYELAEEGVSVTDLISPDVMKEFPQLAGARYRFWKQPPAILLTPDGRYIPNPDAENVDNQPLGMAYWMNQLSGKTLEWIKVYLMGLYGSIVDGKPVYAGQWADHMHVSPVELWPIKSREILVGLDFGLDPTAIIGQISPRGQLRILEELIGEDMGIEQFTTGVLKPELTTKYKSNPYIAVGDPAGKERSQNNAKSVFRELRDNGIIAVAADTNNLAPRHESVRYFLSRLRDGRATFQLSPKCKVLRKGFNGGYRYKKLQVKGTDDRYAPKPEKDMFSHPHDALQYLCMYLRGKAQNAVQAPPASNVRSVPYT